MLPTGDFWEATTSEISLKLLIYLVIQRQSEPATLSLRDRWYLLFRTSRWFGPANPLNRSRDHLLGLWRPPKFRGPRGDYLLCGLAIRLPSQGSGNTN